jgi:hypothetical protein
MTMMMMMVKVEGGKGKVKLGEERYSIAHCTSQPISKQPVQSISNAAAKVCSMSV